MSRRPSPATALLLFVVLCPVAAEAQSGRGLPAYRGTGTTAYQYGYKPTYEVVMVNASLQDLEFRMTRHKDELQQWSKPNSAWVIPAGTFGTIDVKALDLSGYFVTRRGVKIEAEPRYGAYYAVFYVDEERLREFESRNEKGAVVIRKFGEGIRNPDIEEKRLTTHTEKLDRVLHGLDLLRTSRERPGSAGEFLTYKSGGFPLRDGAGTVPNVDEVEKVATSGRIRQPGDQYVTLSLVRAGGENPAGARFSAKVGHDLAYRVESGAVNGDGEVKLFTTRDRNIRLDFTVAGSPVVDETQFTVEPYRDDRFRIRIR